MSSCELQLSFIPLAYSEYGPAQKQMAKVLPDTNASRLYSSRIHQIIPGLFPGLLVLDVPRSYGVATVMAAVIPCKVSIEFPWKWRYASHSQGLVFLL